MSDPSPRSGRHREGRRAGCCPAQDRVARGRFVVRPMAGSEFAPDYPAMPGRAVVGSMLAARTFAASASELSAVPPLSAIHS